MGVEQTATFQEMLHQFRQEMKADMRDALAPVRQEIQRVEQSFRDYTNDHMGKQDILRETDGLRVTLQEHKEDIGALNGRVEAVEVAVKVQSRKWPTSAIAMVTALVTCGLTELGFIINLMMR